jgi:hypothetical protein
MLGGAHPWSVTGRGRPPLPPRLPPPALAAGRQQGLQLLPSGRLPARLTCQPTVNHSILPLLAGARSSVQKHVTTPLITAAPPSPGGTCKYVPGTAGGTRTSAAPSAQGRSCVPTAQCPWRWPGSPTAIPSCVPCIAEHWPVPCLYSPTASAVPHPAGTFHTPLIMPIH